MPNSTLALLKRFTDETGDSLVAGVLTIAHLLSSCEESNNSEGKLLTPVEAAKQLKVSAKKVYQMVKAGKVEHIWVGNQIRIPASSLRDFSACDSLPETVPLRVKDD